MTKTVMEFKKRYSEINNRYELLKLEEEIKEYMRSEAFRMLSDEEKDALDDLFLKVIKKKEYRSGCNPWRLKH